ncbi:MAG: hypothetical protein V3U53_01565 [bacterium]
MLQVEAASFLRSRQDFKPRRGDELGIGDALMDGRNFELRPHRRPSLAKRILSQIFRLVLIGVCLYVVYLGFTLRRFPKPSRQPAAPPAGQVSPPATPSR